MARSKPGRKKPHRWTVAELGKLIGDDQANEAHELAKVAARSVRIALSLEDTTERWCELTQAVLNGIAEFHRSQQS